MALNVLAQLASLKEHQPDVVADNVAPIILRKSSQTPTSQNLNSCEFLVGLPYQDHNYGAPPPVLSVTRTVSPAVAVVTTVNDAPSEISSDVPEENILCSMCHTSISKNLKNQNSAEFNLCSPCHAISLESKERLRSYSSDLSSINKNCSSADTPVNYHESRRRVQRKQCLRRVSSETAKSVKMWDDCYSRFALRYNEVSNCKITIEVANLIDALANDSDIEEYAIVDKIKRKIVFVSERSSGYRRLLLAEDVERNQPLIAYTGRVCTERELNMNVKGPVPFVLYYSKFLNTPLCVDACRYGNAARFISRSSNPNCHVKHHFENGNIHFVIYALYNLPKNTKLCIHYDYESTFLRGSNNFSNNLVFESNSDCEYYHSAKIERIRSFSSSSSSSTTSSSSSLSSSSSSPNSLFSDDQIINFETIKPVNKKQPRYQKLKRPKKPVPSKRRVNIFRHSFSSPEKTFANKPKKSTRKTRTVSEIQPPGKIESPRKLNREERKLEAIMKRFDRLENTRKRKSSKSSCNRSNSESHAIPTDCETHTAIQIQASYPTSLNEEVQAIQQSISMIVNVDESGNESAVASEEVESLPSPIKIIPESSCCNEQSQGSLQLDNSEPIPEKIDLRSSPCSVKEVSLDSEEIINSINSYQAIEELLDEMILTCGNCIEDKINSINVPSHSFKICEEIDHKTELEEPDIALLKSPLTNASPFCEALDLYRKIITASLSQCSFDIHSANNFEYLQIEKSEADQQNGFRSRLSIFEQLNLSIDVEEPTTTTLSPFNDTSYLKTKKMYINEWLNESRNCPSIEKKSPVLAQGCSAKKRWLQKASEERFSDHFDDTAQINSTIENHSPVCPKKRMLKCSVQPENNENDFVEETVFCRDDSFDDIDELFESPRGDNSSNSKRKVSLSEYRKRKNDNTDADVVKEPPKMIPPPAQTKSSSVMEKRNLLTAEQKRRKHILLERAQRQLLEKKKDYVSKDGEDPLQRLRQDLQRSLSTQNQTGSLTRITDDYSSHRNSRQAKKRSKRHKRRKSPRSNEHRKRVARPAESPPPPPPPPPAFAHVVMPTVIPAPIFMTPSPHHTASFPFPCYEPPPAQPPTPVYVRPFNIS